MEQNCGLVWTPVGLVAVAGWGRESPALLELQLGRQVLRHFDCPQHELIGPRRPATVRGCTRLSHTSKYLKHRMFYCPLLCAMDVCNGKCVPERCQQRCRSPGPAGPAKRRLGRSLYFSASFIQIGGRLCASLSFTASARQMCSLERVRGPRIGLSGPTTGQVGGADTPDGIQSV